LRRVATIGLKVQYYTNFELKFWINRFIALALIPLDHLEDGMEIIIETMPRIAQTPEISPSEQNQIQVLLSSSSINAKSIEFAKYFAKQWLNGPQSPEIWNHHETIGRRTNNGLEGHHNKIESTTDKSHPQLQVQVNLCKRENTLSVDKFNRLPYQVLDKPKVPKELQKDEQIFLIHQEFKSNYLETFFFF
jgi:hypothetical protein